MKEDCCVIGKTVDCAQERQGMLRENLEHQDSGSNRDFLANLTTFVGFLRTPSVSLLSKLVIAADTLGLKRGNDLV
jgi:hypothetical protein